MSGVPQSHAFTVLCVTIVASQLRIERQLAKQKATLSPSVSRQALFHVSSKSQPFKHSLIISNFFMSSWKHVCSQTLELSIHACLSFCIVRRQGFVFVWLTWQPLSCWSMSLGTCEYPDAYLWKRRQNGKILLFFHEQWCFNIQSLPPPLSLSADYF